MNFNYLLKEYWGLTPQYSINVLKMVEEDIFKFLNDPYDPNVNYAGRGDSRLFKIAEVIVPEFDMNHIFYIHDRMYDLVKLNIQGYTKEFADLLMRDLMIAAGHENLAEIYYWFVDHFG